MLDVDGSNLPPYFQLVSSSTSSVGRYNKLEFQFVIGYVSGSVNYVSINLAKFQIREKRINLHHL